MGLNLALQEEGFNDAENHEWLGSAHGTDVPQSGTLLNSAWTSIFTDGIVPSGVLVVQKGGGGSDNDLLVPRATGTAKGTNEVQAVTPATSGNTTVGFQGVTAAATAFAADSGGATTLLGLINGLPDIEPGDFTVTVGSGGNAGKLLISAVTGGNWDQEDVPAFTATGTGAGVTTVTAGVAGTGKVLGHLLNTHELSGTKTPVSYIFHGRVIVDNLPANSGWDVAVIDLLPSFTYQV